MGILFSRKLNSLTSTAMHFAFFSILTRDLFTSGNHLSIQKKRIPQPIMTQRFLWPLQTKGRIAPIVVLLEQAVEPDVTLRFVIR